MPDGALRLPRNRSRKRRYLQVPVDPRSNEHLITVRVTRRTAGATIDPYRLLDGRSVMMTTISRGWSLSAEGVRFLHRLSDQGQNSDVNLSMHIVQHVGHRCMKMAIIDAWKIMREPKVAS